MRVSRGEVPWIGGLAVAQGPIRVLLWASATGTEGQGALGGRPSDVLGSQGPDPDQVVGGAGEQQPLAVALTPDVPELPATAHGLHPAEDLLDPLAHPLADRVAGMPSGATVDGAAAVGGVPRQVRGDRQLAASGHEPASVVATIPGDGEPPPPTSASLTAEQIQACLAFCEAGGLEKIQVDDQPVAVLHQNVPRVVELGLLGVALARQASLGIGDRGVGGVAALLAPVVDVRVATTTTSGRAAVAVLGPEALHRGPCLQERSVHGEVLVREVAPHPGLFHHGGEELGRDLVPQQPVPILREGAVVEAAVLNAQAQEPLEEQVVTQPLAELALAAARLQGPDQPRLQQLLRWDTDPALLRVHGVEGGAQRPQHLLDDRLDATDRVILGNELVRRRGREHGHLPDRPASHGSLHSTRIDAVKTPTRTFALATDARRISTPC